MAATRPVPAPTTPLANRWWREIQVGAQSRAPGAPLESTVLLAPGVLSTRECDEIVAAINKHIVLSMSSYTDASGRMRVPVAHLPTTGSSARDIIESLLRDR